MVVGEGHVNFPRPRLDEVLASGRLAGLSAAPSPETAEKLRQARRREEAKELLASAQQAEQGEDFVKAYRYYKRLSDDYADLPEGAQAREKVSDCEAAADFLANITTLQAQGEAAELMNMGNNFFVNKVYSQAIQYYQKVVDTYPDSAAAQQAQAKLEEARRLLEAQLKKPDEAESPVEESP